MNQDVIQLFELVAKGESTLTLSMLEKFESHLDFVDDASGKTSLLMLAADRGNVEAVRVILQFLESSDQAVEEALCFTNDAGNIAIHFAARKSLDATKLLLLADKSEKTVDLQCKNGQNVFDYACGAGQFETVQFLLKNTSCSYLNRTRTAGFSCLILACMSRDTETVKFLIQFLIEKQPNLILQSDFKGNNFLHFIVNQIDLNLLECVFNFEILTRQRDLVRQLLCSRNKLIGTPIDSAKALLLKLRESATIDKDSLSRCVTINVLLAKQLKQVENEAETAAAAILKQHNEPKKKLASKNTLSTQQPKQQQKARKNENRKSIKKLNNENKRHANVNTMIKTNEKSKTTTKPDDNEDDSEWIVVGQRNNNIIEKKNDNNDTDNNTNNDNNNNSSIKNHGKNDKNNNVSSLNKAKQTSVHENDDSLSSNDSDSTNLSVQLESALQSLSATALALDLQPKHVLGVDLNSLSMAQLECLEEISFEIMKRISAAKMSILKPLLEHQNKLI